MSEEQRYWQSLIQELQDWKVTLEMIAAELGVSDRQVSNWKAGQRPTGMTAIRLQEFHGKHRRTIQGIILHGATEK